MAPLKGHGGPGAAGPAAAGSEPASSPGAKGWALDVPPSPPAQSAWSTTMGYEQLLSVQQHQHALELQQKDVELAQMKALSMETNNIL